MKKTITYILFLVFCFTFMISTFKADSCNYKEQAALNKEANNIKIKTELPYKELEDGYTRTINGVVDPNGNNVEGTFSAHQGYYFGLYISNLTENFKIQLSTELYNEENQLVKELTSENAKDGVIFLYTYDLSKRQELTITILGNTANCQEKELKKKRINIPKYNEYSGTTICDGYEDLEICQPFYYTTKSEHEFVNMFNNYIKKENNKTINNKKTFWSNITSLFSKYWWALLIIVFLIGGIIVAVFFIRKRRKV